MSFDIGTAVLMTCWVIILAPEVIEYRRHQEREPLTGRKLASARAGLVLLACVAFVTSTVTRVRYETPELLSTLWGAAVVVSAAVLIMMATNTLITRRGSVDHR